ncbi:MAG: hypothetical protein DI599_07315 [Pseudomonas kuykendallii]|uniref:Glycosyl transferase family 1 domain-containing protein n=2 Tax=Pseudomonas kuykendallii TaxID=1007099 RepID=A0A2W5D5F4_9PSED|nr:MAG: hypothetical protein DI599_07315 [Pseudomonas kuykendallii]
MPSSVRFLVTIHDLTWKRFPETTKPLQCWSERLQMPHSLRKAARIITISAPIRYDLVRYFPAIQAKDCFVRGDVTYLRPGHVNGCCRCSTHCSSARRSGAKTSSVCLRQYAQLAPELRSAYPLLLADGHVWTVGIDQLVDGLGIHTDVVALGAVSGAELGYLYSKAGLLLMPSVYEGFGPPSLEAFQFGVPSVTANCSSMPEVAGAAGRLVDPLQVESIRAGIERLLTDQAAYAERVARIP